MFKNKIYYCLVFSTHLKKYQSENLPQVGVNMKHIWNHHLDMILPCHTGNKIGSLPTSKLFPDEIGSRAEYLSCACRQGCRVTQAILHLLKVWNPYHKFFCKHISETQFGVANNTPLKNNGWDLKVMFSKRNLLFQRSSVGFRGCRPFWIFGTVKEGG